MNAVQIYQMVNNTREVPYCRFHDFVIKDVSRLEECMRRNCDYLYSLYPEEIKVLLKVRR
jgi:hypothetical protein